MIVRIGPECWPLSMIGNLTQRLIRLRSRRALRALTPTLRAVEVESTKAAALTDAEIAERAAALGARIEGGEGGTDVGPLVWALGVEASRRTLGLTPRPEQLLAAFAMHGGAAVEMRTGEGKTLAAALAILPDALARGGVHVVTTNEYLAARDAEWMGPLFTMLGLRAAVSRSGQTLVDKRRAYAADLTYASHSELGFDYLRDHMRLRALDCVQRGRCFALVDEVDSILVDEVRTPLVVGALEDVGDAPYREVTSLVESLAEDLHFSVDAGSKGATLTDHGTDLLEQRLREAGLLTEGRLYDVHNAPLVHVVQQCLAARAVYHRDVDYTLTEDGRVAILDAFTGRTMLGRRWSDGLHQAVEAKERVPLRSHQVTRALCSYRSLFGGYAKLAGMSGTLGGVEEELEEVHGLRVLRLPTHLPVARVDEEDAVFGTEAEKLEALVEDVAARHREGRPVLVGAPTEALAAEIARRLAGSGVPHRLLLARHHAEEAAIVAEAGREGAVTVATQLAGRGTDIRLGGDDPAAAARVASLGGLYVVGVERHRARRVDDQLRGRAGRQGDPGTSRFYVSMQDRMVTRHREERAAALRSDLERTATPRGRERLAGRARALVSQAQGVEESIDARGRRVARELDGILDEQREAFYAQRDAVLRGEGPAPAARPAPERAGAAPAERPRPSTREPVRRLLEAHFVQGRGDMPAVRPRMLAREVYQLFGCALDPQDIPTSPERCAPYVQTRVARSIQSQLRRLRETAWEVAESLVREAAWGEAGALSRLAPRLTALGLDAESLPQEHARASEATERLHGALMAELRGRIRRDRARRVLRYFRLVYLAALDGAWRDHLEAMLVLRDGIQWRALAREEPVLVYRAEAHRHFLAMWESARREALQKLLAAPPLDRSTLQELEDGLREEKRRRAVRRDTL